MSATTLTTTHDTTSLYLAVQQFYARHMQLLDGGEPDAWAATFTPDGSFSAPGLPEAVRGRGALATAVREGAARLAANGEMHRHWHGMTQVTPRDDGSVHVRCYALVVAITDDGTPRLHRSCVCEDILVPAVDGTGDWQVHERRVTPDPPSGRAA
jgi:3-phenylpropionate/cinnamic acid dioxygenase small subunit